MFDPAVANDRREALFGGSGAVRVWDLLRSATLEPFRAVLACELEPGGRVGSHVQQQYPELVVVVSGSGAMAVDDLARPVSPGSVVALPLGATLAIDNTSESEPLRYLIVKADAQRPAR